MNNPYFLHIDAAYPGPPSLFVSNGSSLIPPRDPTAWKIFFRNQLYANLVRTSLVINLEIYQPPTPLISLW